MKPHISAAVCTTSLAYANMLTWVNSAETLV